MHPLISVIIPTLNRPHLVKRAIKSVCNQTLQNFEIIVVIDGPDEQTVNELKQLNLPMLTSISLLENVGPASARNIGVKQARGTWVAFLDDDDEWLPQKLELQLEAAENSQFQFPVVFSRFIALTAKRKLVWPRRAPFVNEHLSDYLFARNSLFLGEGFIQTSTLFIKRELLSKNPLSANKYRHEDWEWLLQVSSLENVGIEFVSEPTAYWHSNIGQTRLSNIEDWHYSLEWIRSVQDLVTPKAYAGFVMTVVSFQAAAVKDWNAFWFLLKEAMQSGKPRGIDFLLYTGIWLIPQNARQQVKSALSFLSKVRFHLSKIVISQSSTSKSTKQKTIL